MASKGVNKVILVGNLGQDPEVRYMPNGGAVVNLSLATSDTWTDKQTGDKKERTEWHRVVLYGKLAEIASEYLRKGSQVYIEGALRTRKWTDQSGVEKYTTEVVVSQSGTMQMLGRCWADEIVREVGSNRAAGVSLSNQQRLLTAGCHLNSILQMSRQWTSTMISRSRRSGTVWPDMRFMCCPENCR